jgi:hypothetical protein
MPPTAEEWDVVFGRFRDELSALLRQTVTAVPLSILGNESRRRLTFCAPNGAPTYVMLNTTRFGLMRFDMTLTCEAVEVPQVPTLRIVKYRYRLFNRNATDALLRWEYVRRPPPQAKWCRHHLNGDTKLPLGLQPTYRFNDLHVATGYVPIEEVLRFFLADVGVVPRSEDWSAILQASYDRFRTGWFVPIGPAGPVAAPPPGVAAPPPQVGETLGPEHQTPPRAS